MNGFFYTSVVLRRNECGCLHVHGAAVLGTDLFTWDTAPFADGAVMSRTRSAMQEKRKKLLRSLYLFVVEKL